MNANLIDKRNGGRYYPSVRHAAENNSSAMGSPVVVGPSRVSQPASGQAAGDSNALRPACDRVRDSLIGPKVLTGT